LRFALGGVRCETEEANMTAKVLFLVLDGLPARHVGHRLTPTLAALAAHGGWAPMGGLAVMPSCTYPNHATFVTGAAPVQHGIHANDVVVNREVVPAASVGPRGLTLFDTCRTAGRSTAAVLGDHHLVAVMAADRADHHWPPHGRLPAATPLDGLGYATDDAVIGPLVAAVGMAPDLLVAHLNGPDTAAHLYGPDSAEALDRYRATDAVLATLLDALGERWPDWAVIVVSDHDQETISAAAPVDLAAAAATSGIDVITVPEGGAALLAGPDPSEGRWLDSVPGVAGHRAFGPDLRLAWTEAGRYVGSQPTALRGVHGGPGQRAQVAVVGGGHPIVQELARTLADRRPTAATWAPAIADLLQVPHPS
jgi:hypothetical protein